MSLILHLLTEELFFHIFRRTSRDFDPGLGEKRTRNQHKSNVEHRMEWISERILELPRRRNIVGKSPNGYTLSAHLKLLPVTKEIDEEVSSEFLGEHLTQKEEVGDKSRLKDDGDVGGVEEFDVVLWGLRSSHVSVFDVDWYLESLERLRKGFIKKVLLGRR